MGNAPLTPTNPACTTWIERLRVMVTGEPLLRAALASFDRALNRAGQARLKVQDANPVGMNEDARHARIEARCFLEQSLCVFLAHRPVNHGRILRCDALNRVRTDRPANDEDLGGRKVTVDTHRHL